jgi:hypothetical protein
MEKAKYNIAGGQIYSTIMIPTILMIYKNEKIYYIIYYITIKIIKIIIFYYFYL